MRKKVLMIDDDHELLALAETWLQDAGYQPVTARDGIEGIQSVYSTRPSLVLLDVNMPQMSGWDVCHRIRQMCDVPVIMLTVNKQSADVLRAFDLGVDDYVTKPFQFQELMARIHSILRRRVPSEADEATSTFHNADIDIDWKSRQVWVRRQKVSLSPTEFRLLSCLIGNGGWIVPHEELLRKVWGPNYFGDKNYVKLYIRYLRQKIERDPGDPKWILTVRGTGYRFAI